MNRHFAAIVPSFIIERCTEAMNESAKTVNGFEDLEVFKRAYKVSLEIHSLSLNFPKHEQFAGLADQMRRASKGICANIAEGYGK